MNNFTFESENLYILTDETGNFQGQEIKDNSYIVATLVYLENNNKAAELSKFLDNVYNLIKESIGDNQKIHLASVREERDQEKIIQHMQDNIHILQSNILTFYVDAINFRKNANLNEISPMHLYLYILRALANHIYPVYSYLLKNKRNIKSVLVNVENLQFIGIYNRLLDENLIDRASKFCEEAIIFSTEDKKFKDFVKDLPKNIKQLLNFGSSTGGRSNKINYEKELIDSLVANGIPKDRFKDSDRKPNLKKLSLLADIYASLFKMEWLKHIKKELSKNLYKVSGDNFNNYNYKNSKCTGSLDITLQINEIFGFYLERGNLYIKEYDNNKYKQINLDGFESTKFETFIKDMFSKNNVNSDISLGLDTNLDKSLLKRLFEEYKNETPLKEGNVQARGILDIYLYMFELLLLNNIGVIDNKRLNKYVNKMPKLYIDNFYQNVTPKHIYSVMFKVLDNEFSKNDLLDEDEYQRLISPIESFDKYPLIRYFLYSNILYSIGTLKPNKNILDDVKNKIEELESKIPKTVFDFLDYDSIHSELNKYYKNGEFDKLREFIDANKDNIKGKIIRSSGIFKRRYLTTLAAILSEMYEGVATYQLLNYIINDLGKKSDIENELYRTKGSLAELYARFEMYEEAINLYKENLNEENLSEYEKHRTKSQMVPILILNGYKENDESYINKAKEYADEVLNYFKERYEIGVSGLEDVLYALFNYVALNIRELKSKYAELNIENESKTLDPQNYAQLPLAIILIALGRIEEALERLIEANFIIEAYDLINSSIGKDYKDKYIKRITEKLKYFNYNSGIRKLSEDILKELSETNQNIEVPSSIKSQDKFFKELEKQRENLITYRINLLNYLRG